MAAGASVHQQERLTCERIEQQQERELFHSSCSRDESACMSTFASDLVLIRWYHE